MAQSRPPKLLLSLVIGVVIGCCLILLFNQSLQLSYRAENNIIPDYSQFSFQQTNENETKFTDIFDGRGKDLYEKVRVLCWVMTTPENHKTKALAVKETWGNRCNIMLFMSSEPDSTLPTVQLPVREGRNELWGKTREAFRYIWNHYQDQADWFLKADDDTYVKSQKDIRYVIVENLRYFLSAFKTTDALWFGHKFKVIVKKGYFSGGAGYVLSKEAVKRFVEEGYFNALICRHDHAGAEDAEMGKCMENLNVSAMDTRDSKGRGRFFPFIPDQHLFPGKVVKGYWYWDNIYYPPKQGNDCCSDSTISFHYVNEKQMRLLDLLIYQIRPFGLADQRPATPEPSPDFDLMEKPWFVPNETVTLNTTNTNVTNANATDVVTAITTNVTTTNLTNTNVTNTNVTNTDNVINTNEANTNVTSTIVTNIPSATNVSSTGNVTITTDIINAIANDTSVTNTNVSKPITTNNVGTNQSDRKFLKFLGPEW